MIKQESEWKGPGFAFSASAACFAFFESACVSHRHAFFILNYNVIAHWTTKRRELLRGRGEVGDWGDSNLNLGEKLRTRAANHSREQQKPIKAPILGEVHARFDKGARINPENGSLEASEVECPSEPEGLVSATKMEWWRLCECDGTEPKGAPGQ